MPVEMRSPVGVPYNFSILDKFSPNPIVIGIVLVVIIAYVALFATVGSGEHNRVIGWAGSAGRILMGMSGFLGSD